MPYCPNCGAENEADAAFCDSCGAALGGEAPPPPTAARPGLGRLLMGAALLVTAGVIGGAVAYFAIGGDGDSIPGPADGTPVRQLTVTGTPTASVTLVPTAISAATITSTPLPPATATIEPTAVPPTPSGHDSPEAAIADWVAPREYAGDCSSTVVEEDAGKVCSSFHGGSGSQLVFIVGLTFSEYTDWLLVEQQGDETWLVVDSAPVLGDAADPPWSVVPDPSVVGYDLPEDAIAAYLEWYGLGYVGDCDFADIDTDVGLYCSVLWEDRGDTLIFAAGMTFSELDTWLLLASEEPGGGWQVVDAAEFVAGPQDSVPPWP